MKSKPGLHLYISLTSSPGHYAVLLLVALDISAIFADLLITSLACEGHISRLDADLSSDILGIVSLIFSSLFMLELLASIWSFGARKFFSSWFHCMDALVIVSGFVIDVLLKGTLEEVGSIVVVLRLCKPSTYAVASQVHSADLIFRESA